MPTRSSTVVVHQLVPKKYSYNTIDELYRLAQSSGSHWCCYGVIKYRRQINNNCMLIGICDPTSYGKGSKGASCLLYYESFAGTIELPVEAEIGQLIRLHRMKITSYRPQSGCIQMKSSNYYSWLIFHGKDGTDYEPFAQSSYSYSYSDEDNRKIDELRTWLLSFVDQKTLETELDFQYFLPEPRNFADQSTQTDVDQQDQVTCENSNEASQFFSATDEFESPRKRLHTGETE